MNSLAEPGLIAFVFGPLVGTVTALATLLWLGMRRQTGADAPTRFLACVLDGMPASRREWNQAMLAELTQFPGGPRRWWFVLGCAKVALFPPRWEGATDRITTLRNARDPICGILAVTLPPLGLPFIYAVAVMLETVFGGGGAPISRLFPQALLVAVRMVAVGAMLAGLPLGLVGLLRGERVRSLALTGPLISIATFCYFFLVMSFVAGGPGAD